MKTYELHCHTRYSRCANLEPKKLLELAKKKGLSGVAITDHNTIKGALEAKKLNKRKDFQVIVGEEVKTDLGDVLVYNVKKEIKPGKFEDVVKEARKQGCVTVIAHPKRTMLCGGYKGFRGDIKKCGKLVDGIESLNGRSFFFDNMKARSAVQKYKLHTIGGSDAHFSFEFGNVTSSFDGSLKDALKKGKIEIKGSSKTMLFGHLCTFLRKHIFRKSH